MAVKLADVKGELEAVVTQARDRCAEILGTPVFVFLAYPDVIDAEGDNASGCWSPQTECEPGQALAASFVLRTRAEELFTEVTGLAWDENEHRRALAIAEGGG